MQPAATYVHALNGRLRIKVPEVKGDQERAQEIENDFCLITGMKYVSANPVTGNVLLVYDPQVLSQEDILKFFYELGCFSDAAGQQIGYVVPARQSHGIVEKITTTIASTLMEVALGRLVSILI
jgi:hypothetical protein